VTALNERVLKAFMLIVTQTLATGFVLSINTSNSAASTPLTGVLIASVFGFDRDKLQAYHRQGVRWVVSYGGYSPQLVSTVHNLGMGILFYVTALQESESFTYGGSPPPDEWLQHDGTSYLKPSYTRTKYGYGFYSIAPYGGYIDSVLLPKIHTLLLGTGADGIFLDSLILRPNADQSSTAYNAWHNLYPALSWQEFRYRSTYDVCKKVYERVKSANPNAILMVSNNNIFTQSDRDKFASSIDRWQGFADGFVLELVGIDPYGSGYSTTLDLISNERINHGVTKPLWIIYDTLRSDAFQYLSAKSVTENFGHWLYWPEYIINLDDTGNARTTDPVFTLSRPSPSSLVVYAGGSGISTITVNSYNGFSSPVTLEIVTIPSGLTVIANPDPPLVTPPRSISLTVSVDISVTTGTYIIVVNGTSGNQFHVRKIYVTVLASARQSFHPHNEFWFTWYDKVNAQIDNIHFVNPSTSTATITVKIAGSQVDSFQLDAGNSTYKNYPGVCNGPVQVTSDQQIWVTQRVVGWNSFKEVPGLPADVATTEIYYTWYDMQYASWDAIHILNPNATSAANVGVYIAGELKRTIRIPPRGTTYLTFPSEIGGPVRIVSDIPIFSTQRVVGWSDFDEVVGLPTWYIFKEHWFTWYDLASPDVQIDNIHLINLGSTDANIQVFVNGIQRASFTLPAGGQTYKNFPGVIGGPLRIVSDQPIRVTQRIVGWNGFKEEFSVPTELMNTKWYFNWYDKANTQIDNIHFLNLGTSDAHVTVTIAGTSYGPYNIPAGGTDYKSYVGVCNGPVIIESDVLIMVSQRIVGWSSFEETLGIQWS